MKTIKEIQQQLDLAMQQLTAVCRYVSEESADVIRNAVLTVQNASAELSTYATEAEETESRFDFDAIELKTNKIYTRHAAYFLTDEEKNGYLMLLCNTMFGEENNTTDCLAYIFGIGLSIGFNGESKSLYARSLNMSPADLERAIAPLRNNSAAAKSLIVDMIVLSEKYITDKSTSRKYITQMIDMLGLDSGEADYLISFAKVLITGKTSGFKTDRRFIDDDLKLYIKGTPSLKKQVLDARSVFYMHIEPHYRQERNGFFGGNYTFYTCDVGEIKASRKGNKLICRISSSYDNTSIEYPIPIDRGLFEQVRKVADSWVPAAGFFHSALDSENEAFEWFDDQSPIDPDYSGMSTKQIFDIATDEAWNCCNYEEMY
ncbi:MAG: hypothetical protein ACI4XF_12210 [Oscillospiraceae bacterium]